MSEDILRGFPKTEASLHLIILKVNVFRFFFFYLFREENEISRQKHFISINNENPSIIAFACLHVRQVPL